MYLSYCEAGFAERRIGLIQALLAKPRWAGRRTRTPATAVTTPAVMSVVGG